ncbi:MAG: SH3 domain-containing protein [Hyphomicrobiales bacterium]
MSIREDSEKKQDAPTSETLFVVAPSGLILRSKPSTSSTKLNKYAYATLVTVISRQEEWVRVLVRSQRGWMHSDYLSPNKPLTETSVRRALAPAKNALSKRQIVKRLIRDSIDAYSGNCPCPYNRDRAGRRRGKRSAYSRPGGASPLCYAGDVTPKMIAEFQAGN